MGFVCFPVRKGGTDMPQLVLLCVDDRPVLLELRKTVLEQHDYSVVTATDTSSAIAILENQAVAAVVLEYKSEGMDAEAVAWLIKRRFPHEPVVLLSAYPDVPQRILWLVDEYVMRSDALEGLLQVLARVTGPAMPKKTCGAAA
jgi:CheY-like chemotaxis protein